jgi:hypothetical protein
MPGVEMLGLEFIERLGHGGKVVNEFAVVTEDLDASLKLADLSGKTHLPYSGDFVSYYTKTKPTYMVS